MAALLSARLAPGSTARSAVEVELRRLPSSCSAPRASSDVRASTSETAVAYSPADDCSTTRQSVERSVPLVTREQSHSTSCRRRLISSTSDGVNSGTELAAGSAPAAGAADTEPSHSTPVHVLRIARHLARRHAATTASTTAVCSGHLTSASAATSANASRYGEAMTRGDDGGVGARWSAPSLEIHALVDGNV
eukprot:5049291-Prymnesium_polylepis.1